MYTYKDICTYYTLHIQKDNYGKKIIETILRELMQNCLEFIEYYKLLKTNAHNMRDSGDHIIIDRTIKFQPGIYCEGF